MPTALPLTGIRVLELGHIIAGPTAGLILADLGADVIKIESPHGGDQGRRSMRQAFPFFNRNKRSVSLDLRSDQGRGIFLRLAASADVALDNYSPGVAERLGVCYEDLVPVNERLVYLSVKGFLPGPYFERPSLDELAQMMGGLAFMTGPAGRPLRAGASVIDVGAATYGVVGVLSALLVRATTGRGQKIVSGLFETSVFWVGQWMALAASDRAPSVPMPERGQGARTAWSVYQLFQCADDVQLFVGITSDAHWQRFCECFGLEELAVDERLQSNALRDAARAWLIPRIADVLGKFSAAELSARLETAGIPFAPVRRPDELLHDAHLLTSDQLLDTPLYGGVTAGMPKLPLESNSYEFELRRRAPGLGEHTAEILAECGVTSEELKSLAANGTVSLGTDLETEWSLASL